MAGSRDNLVINLEKLQLNWSKDALLTHKGKNPYKYMDRFERVNEKNLLQKDNFHSTLGGKIITDEEFKFALNVYKKCKCESIGDCHDSYLKTDIELLADFF